MMNHYALDQTIRNILYENNPIFVQNHTNCVDKLFDTFHELRESHISPRVEVWLESLVSVLPFFSFDESERKMFLIVGEHFYSNVQYSFEDYPLDSSPEFHCKCEKFIGWFDSYLKREEEVR